MPPMTAMSEAERRELQGAAIRLTDYLNAAPPVVARCINTPIAGSRLAVEAAEDASFTATSMAVSYLFGAEQHLVLVHQGLSATPIATLALVPVVRAALEGSVRALWLLDPALTTRQRIERGLLERCASLDSARKVKADPAHQVARAAQIREVAAAHSIRVEGAPLPRRVGGNVRPSVTQLAQEALAELRGKDPKNAAAAEREGWFFAWLSAVAHSAAWALFTKQIEAEEPGGYPTVQISGDAVNLAGAIDLVRHMHRLAVQRLALFAGHQAPNL